MVFKEKRMVFIALLFSVGAGILRFVPLGGSIPAFVVSAMALSLLAALVGMSTEHVGERLSSGATGVLQSAIGNLPELFVGIFALKAGLIEVLQAALIGSMLANSLLVLGLAFFVGGLKNGTQRFDSEQPRVLATLTLLAVSALVIPTLASVLHTPAGHHTIALSTACAGLLLFVFALSIPYSLQAGSEVIDPDACDLDDTAETATWPLSLAITVLGIAGLGSAFVSEWFVTALEPATKALHLSAAFTGLVIVAIAGNAVENVVAIRLAAKNKADYAVSVILNSSLQVAMFLIPVLVILSFIIGGTPLTLVMPPLLVAAVALSAIIGAVVVFDGESIWLEGVVLIGLYGIIAASFWWG